MFGICLRMLRDRDAALDAVQETFITVFRKADRYKGEAAFSTWLYRVAVNTCYDQLRKAKRKTAQPLPDTLDPPDPKSADSFDSAELRPQIEDALETLPPEFRAAACSSTLKVWLSKQPPICSRFRWAPLNPASFEDGSCWQKNSGT